MTKDNVTMKSDDFSKLFEAEFPEVKRTNRTYFRSKMRAKNSRGVDIYLVLKNRFRKCLSMKTKKKIKIFQF